HLPATPAARLAMKPVGEPDAGEPHVRFDERGRETDPSSYRSSDTAPVLDSTGSLEPELSPTVPAAAPARRPRRPWPPGGGCARRSADGSRTARPPNAGAAG